MPHDRMSSTKNIAVWFEEQAFRTPDAVAVACDGKALTYTELDDASDRLAGHLSSALGLSGFRACVVVGRSHWAPVCMLGVLKAGGAYVAVDPSYPRARKEFILRDSGASALIGTSKSLTHVLLDRGNRTPVVAVDKLDPEGVRAGKRTTPARASDLAFISYTSGSTGRPKGVMTTQANVCRYLLGLSRALPVSRADRFLHTASFAFSSSNRQMWLPLSLGAGIVIASERQCRNPLELFELVRSRRITVVDITPSFWRSCIAVLSRHQAQRVKVVAQSDLRVVLSASEQLFADIPASWRKLGFRSRLFNMYGATETTGIVCTYEIPAETEARGSIAIGRPIDGVECHLLDENGRQVRDGREGVLRVKGETVAVGYVGEPELSERVFDGLPGPDRGYRTGDVCRRRPDGVLVHVGRSDAEIKIRGFRIHPAEIENLLLKHPSVDGAAVVQAPVNGEPRLVAYVSGRQQIDAAGLGAVLRSLKGDLPEHMVPSHIFQLVGLPMTPNGKIDRGALAAIVPSAVQAEMHRALKSRDEQRVAAIWAETLGLPRIDPQSTFLELGGNSLVALHIVTRILDEFGVEMDPSAVAAAGNVSQFVARFDQRRKPRPESAP